MTKLGHITALTRESAWKAKQMYEEKDERGRRKWTIQQIADFLGVGESTAWRAIRSVGPYQSLPEVKPIEVLTKEALDSKRRFMKMALEQGLPITGEDGKPLSAAERMALQIRLTKEENEAGDKMLGELKGEPT